MPANNVVIYEENRIDGFIEIIHESRKEEMNWLYKVIGKDEEIAKRIFVPTGTVSHNFKADLQ